jgi:hypothetical protein
MGEKMPRAGNGYDEINNIKEDLNALREDIVSLGAQLQEDGYARAQKLGKSVKAAGDRSITHVEKKIKANPRQSLVTAFVAGVVASYFLGRK